MHDPLAQFQIKKLIPIQIGKYDLSFTNSSLSLFVVLCILMFVAYVASRKKQTALGDKKHALLPNRMEAGAEMFYDIATGMAKSTAGPKALSFVPFIFSLYMFLILCNLLGMLPGAFTVASHIIFTFALAMFVFLGVTLVGIIKHGFKFLFLFVPHGTPLFMAPLMFFIELFAYMARPVSLSLRLTANMSAGHIMLKVIASLTILSGVLCFFPLALLTILTGFEIFICILQAYIFTILTCVYLGDALNLH